MAVETILSVGIQNLDANPAFPNTAGQYGKANLCQIDGYVTAAASDSVNSVYKFARVPTDCSVKQIWLENEAETAGAADIGVYYSDNALDGSPPALVGTAVLQALFGSAVSLASAAKVDVTNESGTYTLDKRTLPLWKAAGLSADPGGFFDICATLTTAITTGTGRVGVNVTYTVPGA